MKKIKLISFALAIIMIVGMLAIPASAATWTWRQQKLNDMLYDSQTVLGYGENGYVSAAIRDAFKSESGQSVSGSYYYSAIDNKTYYANGGVINGKPTDNNGYNPNYNNGTSYWDGTYLWYWDASSGYYYRLDQWGNKIWGSRSGGTSTGGGTGYNYTYRGKSLFPGGNGVITGVDSYVDLNQAKMLANMISLSGKNEVSLTKQAGIGLSVLLCAGGPSNLTDQWLRNTYSWYKPEKVTTYIDSSGRDILALAKDILFRWQAWKSGTCAKWGGVLEDGYVFLTTVEGSGTTIIHKDRNVVTDYTFPYKFDNNSIYRTPYNT